MSVQKFSVTKSKSSYSSLPNSVLQNCKNLSALGLWCYLQSKPEEWDFYKEDLQKIFNIGEHKLETLFLFLKQHNLIEITHKRNEKGQFSDWHLHVKDGIEFDPSGKSWSTDKSPSGKNRTPVNRAPVIRSYKEKNIENKDKQKKEFILPEWIDVQDWSDFIEHRKQLKPPLTQNAKTRLINSLQKLKVQGQNISDVINQTIVNGWKAFFPLRNNQSRGSHNGNKRKTNAGTHFDSCKESLKGTIFDNYQSIDDSLGKETD